MMLRQAQTSEPRALPRVAPVRPRTASRANPPFVRLPPPHARANARFAWEKAHRYGGAASSGSVVGNDPVNHVDPTGLSCTQNKDGAYACKVDSDPAGVFKGKGGADRLAMANQAYTAATNALAARPNQTIKVTVDGKTISVKSGELARTLAGANVTTANNSRSSQTTLATGSGGALCASCRNVLSPSTPSLTIYSKSFDFSRGSPSFMARDMMDTFMHESIHMHPTAELPYAAMYASDPDKFNRDHQGPYESAIAPIMRTIP